MPKSPTTLYICTHCDAQYPKWSGRCLECGKWGTLEEETPSPKMEDKKKKAASYKATKTISVKDIAAAKEARMSTGIEELNRVLGGGLVPGSFILLGGEPGIGKSTLSLQFSYSVKDTLYISGEESVGQIKMRSNRLTAAKDSHGPHLANEIHLETIIATIREKKPKLAIIDSIQTLQSDDADSGPGSVAQVRICAAKLLECAKSSETAIVLIGHVTKEGDVAGPRTLEHLVDTVLYLEGDRYHNMRILRAVKNRFGSTDEIGMFEMREDGLVEVSNPSEMLLEERGEGMSGSVVTCLMEGSRPLLVEVQALVNKTTFGYPVRKSSGFDLNRLHVLVAVLQKRAGLNLGEYDVHINVVGGIKANEPAVDLAICLAIASAYKDKILGNDLAVFGEVGLGGEIRSVRFLEKRIKECETLGMKRIITKLRSETLTSKIDLTSVKNIAELIKHT